MDITVLVKLMLFSRVIPKPSLLAIPHQAKELTMALNNEKAKLICGSLWIVWSKQQIRTNVQGVSHRVLFVNQKVLIAMTMMVKAGE